MKKTILAVLTHLLVLVAVVTVFGMTSASTREEGGEKFTGVIERNVKLRVLENDTAIEQGYLSELLSAFNKAYADYGIEAVDANMDQYLDLEKDGPYGYGPDVLYQANDMLMKYTDGKHIQPLPVEQLDCYDKIDQKAWDAYRTTVGEKTYVCGVPVNIQGPMLYYRKDQLPDDWQTRWDDDRNGVPDMIESWNALYRYSQKLKSESSGKKYGYMKSMYDVYFASGYLFSYGAYVFGENNTDTKDIGFSKGDAAKGAMMIKQLAGIMNQDCIDDTITKNAYSKLAQGAYFATMTTPDVYTLFIKELRIEYQKRGMSAADADKKARENLIMADLPQLPVSGDITERNPELMPCKMMGGINGYAVSSYTKSPNACLAFVDFATSYQMQMKRNELLGIVPARGDAAEDVGGLTETVNENLAAGNIVVMPSVRAVAQIWTPTETFFSDLAKDAFRKTSEQKYHTIDDFQKGLVKVDHQIYDAIHTLS